MTLFEADETARLRVLRAKAEEAIALALRNKWAEAIEANRAILEVVPEDVDALNRLANALLESAQLEEAREAVEKALAAAPHNPIARKNAGRLVRAEAKATEQKPVTAAHTSFSLDLFIEEAGKSATTTLVESGDPAVVQKLVGGEPVHLVQDGSRLIVRSRWDEYIGRVQPRLAQRVLSLIEAGNRYAAAVLHVVGQEVRIIIREVYQDPSLSGKPSFPPLRPDGFRPYVRGGRNLVDYDLGEPAIESIDEGEDAEELAEERTPPVVEPSEDDEDDSV